MEQQEMRILAGIVRALMPEADLKQRAEEVEVRGSTDNKLALAGECSAHQMHGEAIRLYESCLPGGYSRGDSTILFRLAGAAVDAAQWDKADGAIARLKSEAPKMRPLEVRLLEARVLGCRDRGVPGNPSGLPRARGALPLRLAAHEARQARGGVGDVRPGRRARPAVSRADQGGRALGGRGEAGAARRLSDPGRSGSIGP